MATQKIDIVVHVDETLGEDGRQRIEKALTGQPGVAWAHFTPKRPHLMTIEFDPNITNSGNILEAVKGQKVHAELIAPTWL